MASIVVAGDTSGSITLAAPAVAGTNTITLPTSTGTMALTASPTFTGTATIPTATVTTLNAPSGVLATQNGMTGISKAWVRYTWNGSTITINGNFNISSITRNSTGTYTFSFTTALPDANYAVATAQGLTPDNGTNIIPILYWNGSSDANPTTSSFVVRFVAPTTGGAFDPKVVGLIVNGN